jgi:hypothetical protein
MLQDCSKHIQLRVELLPGWQPAWIMWAGSVVPPAGSYKISKNELSDQTRNCSTGRLSDLHPTLGWG